MPDEPPPRPAPPAPAGRDARAERLAAALRENLRRRKAQSRARAAGDTPPAASPDRTEGMGEED